MRAMLVGYRAVPSHANRGRPLLSKHLTLGGRHTLSLRRAGIYYLQ